MPLLVPLRAGAAPRRTAGAPAVDVRIVDPAGDVDVRLVDLAVGPGALARAESTLAPEEVARARRGTPAVHRRRVLLRAALRAALGAELDLDPGRVPLDTTPTGRPVVASWVGAALDVSCSASGRLGLVAVGRGCRIGIDVETVTPWSPGVLEEGWLSRTEIRMLGRLPAAARAAAAARSWTQKEAVLKARGTGLRGDPAATVTVIGREDGRVAGWQVRDVPVPAGWMASLALAPDEEMPA